MDELQSVFRKAFWSLAAGGLLYIILIFALTFPEVQRFVLYANKINPTYWQNLNQVEQFGFSKSQVQPFHFVTSDNEVLYGWHMLPLHLCHEHEQELNENPPSGPMHDYRETVAYKLLHNDPNARVVVSFHGNAAHLASAQRPSNYNLLLGLSTPSNPIHVFAIDYRGFGLSSGSPTEEGLITDGVSLLNFLTAGHFQIPPSRIVISGQSLGTAVTAAVAERYAFGSLDPTIAQPALLDPEPFAGVILLASFSSLPSLIESYSVKGLTPPLLSPLVGYPGCKKWVTSHIVDSWNTAGRLARLTGVNSSDAATPVSKYSHKNVNLIIIHALNDVEIPRHEGRLNWAAATGENIESAPGILTLKKTGSSGEVKIWENRIINQDGSKALKRVRWEQVPYGGHNRVASFSVTGLAVLRSFKEHSN
ncbi:hypothetical protein N7495_006906 [Penicillium taxi]|uniref:uncharacterized protein n=1 Tax=Penicillium taxi TaxID=168475 RepID=UPI002544EC34|nr:uncharacterized protein N7495_006906 [Penicillium taxi]KAJ5895215.1 hypothetical protein N7495_006906 [Penicillium taxi]